MWEFLKTVLEEHGLSAAVLISVIIASGVAIRALYKRTMDMAKEMADIRLKEHEKRSEMRAATTADVAQLKEAHTSEVAALKLHHAEALGRVQEEWRKDEARCASRIDELQERRVSEGQEFVREATRHVASTREEIGKIGRSMDVLTDVMTGRR